MGEATQVCLGCCPQPRVVGALQIELYVAQLGVEIAHILKHLPDIFRAVDAIGIQQAHQAFGGPAATGAILAAPTARGERRPDSRPFGQNDQQPCTVRDALAVAVAPDRLG